MSAIYLLLTSLGILLVGHGLQLSLLPLYAQTLGWSELSIGLSGATYFGGFIFGCLSAAKLLGRAGAIRVFICLASLAAAILLLLQVLQDPVIWMALRFLTGWCLATIYATTEGWLNDHAEPHNRGRMMGFYVTTTLVGMALGQSLLALVDLNQLFTLGAVVMILAVVPVGLFCEERVVEIRSVRFRPEMLSQMPIMATAGVFLGGVVTGGIWTLAPLMVESKGYSQAMIAVVMNAIVLGGAMSQLPLGAASDRFGRRSMVIFCGIAGSVTSLGLIFQPFDSVVIFVVGMFLFGGAALALYTLCASEAQDNTPFSRVETASLLLLLNGCGSMIGPILIGALSTWFDDALLMISVLMMILIVGVAVRARHEKADVLNFERPAEREESEEPDTRIVPVQEAA